MLRTLMAILTLIVFFLIPPVATAAGAPKPKLEPGVYNGEFAVTNRNTLRPETGPVTVVIGTNRQVTVYMWSEGPDFTGTRRQITARQFNTGVRYTPTSRPFATFVGKTTTTNNIGGRVQCHFPPLGRGGFTAERYTGGDTSMFTDAQRQILAENGY